MGLVNVGKRLVGATGRGMAATGRGIGRGARATGRGVGKATKATGRGMGRAALSRGGFAVVGTAALGAGLLSETAPAVRDAAMDVAFDDPNADVAFLGKKMSTRFLMGTAMGGPLGAGLQATAPGDYFTANPMGAAGAAQGGLIAGTAVAGIGALAGAGTMAAKTYGGARVGAAALQSGLGMRAAGKEALSGVLQGVRAGGKKGLKSMALGAAIGAVGVGGAALGVRSHIRNNQQFFQESPYAGRTSGAIASSMNASGDIVLGMHNSRRGY